MYTSTTEIYPYCHTLSLHDALPISGRGVRVDGQAAAVVGDTDRSVGVQGDGHRGAAVAGIGDLFDGVVDQLAQGGVEHVEAQVHRRPQARVLDIVELGDVCGVVTHCWLSPSGPGGIAGGMESGRAHVCTPVTNANLVCRLLLEKK